MPLVLNEDQLMLQDAAKNFCAEKAPISVLRKLRDSKDANGYDLNLWREMVALGWSGMTIPEAYGGYQFGYGGLGVILEETGKTLLPSPLLATVALGASAIFLGGNEEQKSSVLPAVVGGESLLALAVDETPFHKPSQIQCQAKADGNDFVLNGKKVFVLDGHVAKHLIVVARTSGGSHDEQGISLFLMDCDAPGIEIQREWMVDSRNAATVTLNNVRVSASSLVGKCDQGFALLEQVLDIGRICLSAEMLGSIQQVFDTTVQYLKDRSQFGVPIGAFQALQHRAALMYNDIELCRSLVREAFSALDEGAEPQRIAELASATKAKLSETFFTVSNEGVQMHGGIGMTDEFDIGFYLKRARVAQQSLGDAGFHRDRYASLTGF